MAGKISIKLNFPSSEFDTITQYGLDNNLPLDYLEYMATQATGKNGRGIFHFHQDDQEIDMSDVSARIIDEATSENNDDKHFVVSATEKTAGCNPFLKPKKIYIKNALDRQLKARVSCATLHFDQERDRCLEMGIEVGVDNVGANFSLDSTGRKKIFEDKTKTVTLEVHQMTKIHLTKHMDESNLFVEIFEMPVPRSKTRPIKEFTSGAGGCFTLYETSNGMVHCDEGLNKKDENDWRTKSKRNPDPHKKMELDEECSTCGYEKS